MKRDRILSLKHILASSRDWVTADALALMLHTTPRTIRNYVQQITSEETQGILESSRLGYRWRGSGVTAKAEGAWENRYEPSSPNDRYWYMIRKILVEETTLDTLMDDLFISDSTVDADLRRIRKIAAEDHVKLRRTGDTLRFSGRTVDIRRLAYRCVLNSISGRYLTVDFIVQAFPEYDTAGILGAMRSVLAKYGLTAYTFEEAELFLLIMLQHREVSLKHSITAPECGITGLQNYYEFRAARAMADDIKGLTGTSYSIWEQEYLACMIISKTQGTDPEKYTLIPDYPEVRRFAAAYLRTSDEVLGTSLSSDRLTDVFTAHFMRLFVRAKMEFLSNEVLYSSLKDTWPVLADAAAWILLLFAEEFHVAAHRSEIGFLTQLLCEEIRKSGRPLSGRVPCTLICPTFDIFPKALLESLESHLGDAVEIRRITDDAMDVRENDPEELIITALPLPFHVKHSVYVSFYPRTSGFRHIYEEIHRMKMRGYAKKLAALLTGLLTEDGFSVSPSFSSVEQAKRETVQTILEKGTAEPLFSHYIEAREALDPSVFSGGLVLFHTSGDYISRSFVRILTFPNGIPWETAGRRDGKQIAVSARLIFFIGTRSEDVQKMHAVYDLAVKVFTNAGNMSAAMNIKSRAELLALLENLEIP